MEPAFFATPSAWRSWLKRYHAKSNEVLVGLYKKDSGKPSITWPEAVDGALCFGWIDGVRRRIDDASYVIRFTPRQRRSIWSAVNVKRVQELTKMGHMEPPGLRAFQEREEARSGIYSYEQRDAAEFPDDYEQRFRANKKAWDFFQAQVPWFKRTATWRVISAKKEETRLKRLAAIIDDCAQGRG